MKQIFPNHAICAVSSQTHFCVFSFAWLPAVFSQHVILFAVWFIAHQAFYLVRHCFTLGHLGWVIQVNGVLQPHDKDSVEQELKKAMDPCTELCLSHNVAFPGANKLFIPFINNWNAKLLKCEVIDLAILYWAANMHVFPLIWVCIHKWLPAPLPLALASVSGSGPHSFSYHDVIYWDLFDVWCFFSSNWRSIISILATCLIVFQVSPIQTTSSSCHSLWVQTHSRTNFIPPLAE